MNKIMRIFGLVTVGEHEAEKKNLTIAMQEMEDAHESETWSYISDIAKHVSRNDELQQNNRDLLARIDQLQRTVEYWQAECEAARSRIDCGIK